MNKSSILKAGRFLLLPSLFVFALIFLWFFSWTDFSAFVTSKSGNASMLRLLLGILETALFVYMYLFYDGRRANEEAVKAEEEKEKLRREENKKREDSVYRVGKDLSIGRYLHKGLINNYSSNLDIPKGILIPGGGPRDSRHSVVVRGTDDPTVFYLQVITE